PHPIASVPLVGLQFAIQPFPQNGTGVLLGATINVGSSVSMRFIADPGDWDESQHGITLGESGIPTSPHWIDQLPDWRAVRPRAFPFTSAAVAKATKETVILEPAKLQTRAGGFFVRSNFRPQLCNKLQRTSNVYASGSRIPPQVGTVTESFI